MKNEWTVKNIVTDILESADVFMDNTNSAEDYKESLAEYLEELIKNRGWSSMNESGLYLEGVKNTLQAIVDILRKY